MKTDARPDRDEGPGSAELRAFLRHWQAPAPPPGFEDALRREFQRRRRPRRGPLRWGAIAAGIALLVTGLLLARRGSQESGVADAVAPRMAATVAPTPLPEPVAHNAEAARERVAERTARAARRADRAQTPSRREPEIVVEPRQAELLAQLGQKLWETRQAAPGIEVVAMPEVRAPTYRAEWQPVAGVWPQVQQSVSDMGR